MAACSMWLQLARPKNINILRPAATSVYARSRWSSTPFFANTRTEDKNVTEESQTPNVQQDPSDLLAERDKLLKEKESSVEKIKDLDDKYKRALAETENLRQRMQRQIQDAKQFGIQGFCKDLLEVADVLQQATASVPAEELSPERNPRLCNLHQGLTMTETQLRKVFERNGLVQIDPLGLKFDPNQHEALFEQPVEGKVPGTVAVVTKVGYRLHERTIRPALVGVVKKV